LSGDVLAPDLRGFGGTPPGPDEPSIDLMADDLARLLERQNIPRAIIAGFSMGGYVALSFAERYASRMAGLGLINSQALADREEARAGRRAMVERVRSEGAGVAAAAAIPKMFAAANRAKPELAAIVRAGAEKAGVAGITWALEAMARRPDRSAVLAGLTVPVLIVHGVEDQFIPVERARALAEQMPGALYVEISGAGHCSPVETPDIVAKALGELTARAACAAR
jgi:pimeloyl-ACP methyl ester carboxylesterase